MAKRRRVAGLLSSLALPLGAAAVVASCSSSNGIAPGPKSGCSINSDCDSPLVCAFGACHTQCTSSVRDCPAGERCVPSGVVGEDVCQLPGEATCGADASTGAASCVGNETCGSDGQCRSPCLTLSDCLTDQACVGGSCHDENDSVDKPEIGDAAIVGVGGGPDGAAAPDGPGTGDASPDAVTSAEGSSDAPASAEGSSDAPASADGSFVPNPADGPLGFLPSNFSPTSVDGGATGAEGIWTGAADVTVASSCGNDTVGDCLPSAGAPLVVTMSDGTQANLYVLRSLTISQTAVLGPLSGPLPIILAVLTTVNVQGQLLVTGNGNDAIGPVGPGVGGFAQGPGVGGTSSDEGAGAGGSFCGVGGTGSAPQPPTSPAGTTYGNATLSPLVGGSGGGNGGDEGGGAIEIVAGTSITVGPYGAINAGGGGSVGGRGGGSGGAILLEAPTVTINGAVAANGGGGAGGDAFAGSTALASAQAAPGGGQGEDAGEGVGGMGSAGATLNGGNGINNGANVGAGGGGAGRILILTASGAGTPPGVVSPALGTACAALGSLTQ